MTSIKMSKQFGDFCANGESAVQFLQKQIIPLIDGGEKIVFDFEGIRNMNSSFANALFANLIIQYGQNILEKISFIHCRSNIQMLIAAALEIGGRKS